MARHDVDALDARVRRLQAVVDYLDDEHESVRSQIASLETAVDGFSANGGEGGWTSTDDIEDTRPSATATIGASDEEVEEAIRSVEGYGDTGDIEDIDDDILVV